MGDGQQSRSSVIVGAGVTGLVCARALLEEGVSVVVVEASSDIFPSSASLERFAAELVKQHPDLEQLFSLPEYLPPAGASPDDLHKYLLSYVEHFGLRQHIIFSCRLEHAMVGDDGRWTIVCTDLLDPARLHRLTADTLIISSGACLAPSIPQLPGSADFMGLRCHDRDLRLHRGRRPGDGDGGDGSGGGGGSGAEEFHPGPLLAGQRVVVAGDDKAAVDCARRAVEAGAASVTLLYRQPHWPLPPTLFGRALPHLAHSRCLPGLLLPPYYTAGRGARALSSALRPLRRLFWWRLERRLAAQHGLDADTTPPVDILRDMFYGVQVGCSPGNSLLHLFHDRISPTVLHATNGRAAAIAATAAAGVLHGSAPVQISTGAGGAVSAVAMAAAAAASAAAGGRMHGGGSSGGVYGGRRSSVVVFSNVLGNDDFTDLLAAAGTGDGRPEGVIDVQDVSRSALTLLDEETEGDALMSPLSSAAAAAAAATGAPAGPNPGGAAGRPWPAHGALAGSIGSGGGGIGSGSGSGSVRHQSRSAVFPPGAVRSSSATTSSAERAAGGAGASGARLTAAELLAARTRSRCATAEGYHSSAPLRAAAAAALGMPALGGGIDSGRGSPGGGSPGGGSGSGPFGRAAGSRPNGSASSSGALREPHPQQQNLGFQLVTAAGGGGGGSTGGGSIGGGSGREWFLAVPEDAAEGAAAVDGGDGEVGRRCPSAAASGTAGAAAGSRHAVGRARGQRQQEGEEEEEEGGGGQRAPIRSLSVLGMDAVPLGDSLGAALAVLRGERQYPSPSASRVADLRSDTNAACGASASAGAGAAAPPPASGRLRGRSGSVAGSESGRALHHTDSGAALPSPAHGSEVIRAAQAAPSTAAAAAAAAALESPPLPASPRRDKDSRVISGRLKLMRGWQNLKAALGLSTHSRRPSGSFVGDRRQSGSSLRRGNSCITHDGHSMPAVAAAAAAGAATAKAMPPSPPSTMSSGALRAALQPARRVHSSFSAAAAAAAASAASDVSVTSRRALLTGSFGGTVRAAPASSGDDDGGAPPDIGRADGGPSFTVTAAAAAAAAMLASAGAASLPAAEAAPGSPPPPPVGSIPFLLRRTSALGATGAVGMRPQPDSSIFRTPSYATSVAVEAATAAAAAAAASPYGASVAALGSPGMRSVVPSAASAAATPAAAAARSQAQSQAQAQAQGGGRGRALPRRRPSLLRAILSPASLGFGAITGGGGGGGSGGGASASTAGASPPLPLPSAAAGSRQRRLPKRVASELPGMWQRSQLLGSDHHHVLSPHLFDSSDYAAYNSSGTGGGGGSGDPGTTSSAASHSPARGGMAAAAAATAAAAGSLQRHASGTAAAAAAAAAAPPRRGRVRRNSVIESLLAEMAEDGSLGGAVGSSSGMMPAGGTFTSSSALAMPPSAHASSAGPHYSSAAAVDPHAPEGVLAWERPRGWEVGELELAAPHRGEGGGGGARAGVAGGRRSGGGAGGDLPERRGTGLDSPWLLAASGLPSVILAGATTPMHSPGMGQKPQRSGNFSQLPSPAVTGRRG
ncbi:hypothetical protein GPECTOR_11g41 [Gonium pectorale]|uniref:indole-3-pyruvate monooxygenase n=1 Tax=Gonium pectorale TaxID=33097 RepID=A0A150GQ34_GONPE|nr:hypothetical protein GPECTOR_11g41 [Gonium pectorale]|eukprot:KXZ51914.1 hypothetical protein GPECTOR_11g41 [Gonium pectorale]